MIFAITQIIGGWIYEIFGVGQSVAARSAQAESAVIPAGYAFSIWGFIFLFCILYSTYQALPSQRENELLRKIGFYTAGAFLFNTIWQVVATMITFNWPTLIIIVIIAVFAISALLVFTAHRRNLQTNNRDITIKEKWLIMTPVSVLAGWISAATFANLSSVLYQAGIGVERTADTTISSMIIVVATIFAGYILIRSKNNILYAATIVWALIAIAYANLAEADKNMTVGVVTILMIIIFIGISLIYKFKQSKKDSVTNN